MHAMIAKKSQILAAYWSSNMYLLACQPFMSMNAQIAIKNINWINLILRFFMNDFTKEELKIIYFWGLDRLEAIGLSEFKKEAGDFLYNKIGSMIDNYCEHEWRALSLTPHFLMMCAKCRKTLVSSNFPG